MVSENQTGPCVYRPISGRRLEEIVSLRGLEVLEAGAWLAACCGIYAWSLVTTGCLMVVMAPESIREIC
jgi:hypothetical protein